MKKFFVLLFGLIILILIGGCQNLGNIPPFLNRAPVIISEPIITAQEDQLYSYQIEASDPDGDNLNYSLIIKPEGMSINTEKNGLITWMPTNNQVGIHQVIVEISDGKYKVQQIFEIEVINVNNPPQILSYFPVNLNIEINEGDSVKFEIQGTDVDLNTTLDYRWFLEGGLISNSSGIGSASKSTWKYFSEYGDCGIKTVKVLVSDGEFEDSVQWKITIKDITPPNQPTINEVSSPTNISTQILSGTKDANTSIWINGTEAVPLNSSTDWSYSLELIEGENNLSITSRDVSGNESTAVIANIILDTIKPEAPTLNAVISPTNISPQNLSGTKEAGSSILINNMEVIPINSSIVWSYYLDLNEGINSIKITSKDIVSNESSVTTAEIEYDLNTYIDAGNNSGIEDGTKTYPYNTISEGLVVATPGESVIVNAGTYNEQLVINKGIILKGLNQDNTFITGNGLTGNLINLAADHITISDFTIEGANSTTIGIYFDSFSFININNNLIKDNKDYGLCYSNSNPTIENNIIKNNGSSGIEVGTGGIGEIKNNYIISNKYGIRTCKDSSPKISNNEINNNLDSGIYCRESAVPIIFYNTISNNKNCGILIDSILGNVVNPDIGNEYPSGESSPGGNEITGNTNYGIRNKTNHPIKAEKNWWGDAAGPKWSGNTTTTGDRVYWDNANGTIDFYPWLTIAP